MKLPLIFILIIGFALIIIHGLLPTKFIVDSISVLILFILIVPYFAPYLKRAKIPGAEFEFRENIKETQKAVERSIEKTKEDIKTKKIKKILPFETFEASRVKELLKSDHILALAALRIEIEKKLRIVASLNLSQKERSLPLFRIIDALRKKEILYPEQINALQRIITMCNKAIHGYSLPKDMAKKIIDLVDGLNKSFPCGYSINFIKNPDYKKHGLVCEWEHCIEWMLLTRRPTKKSCRLFGHNCPGGIQRVKECGKTIKDFPKKRFIKNS